MPFIYVAKCLNAPPEPGQTLEFRKAIIPAEILAACEQYNTEIRKTSETQYVIPLEKLTAITNFKASKETSIPYALKAQINTTTEATALDTLKVRVMLQHIDDFIITIAHIVPSCCPILSDLLDRGTANYHYRELCLLNWAELSESFLKMT